MTTFTDNLDGTAGALLSARSGWSRPVGADDLPIDTSGSGVRLANGATAAFTFHAPDSQPAGNDQYVEAILGVTSGYPMCVRAAISGGVLGQAYIGRRDASARFRLYHRSAANALTLIGSSTAFTSANADANPFRLEAVGDQLTVYFMGSVLIGPITNASSPSGQVGIFTRAGTLTTFAGVDNWGSGDVGAASQTVTVPRIDNVTTLYPPSVSLVSGAQTVTVPRIGNVVQLFPPSVEAGAVSVSVPRIDNVTTLYPPSVSAGTVIALPRIDNVTTLYPPTIEAGGAVVSVPRIDNVTALYPPGVSFDQTISVPRIDSVAVMFPPSVSTGSDEQYPLAGQSQGFPLAGLSQTYPLQGRVAA